MLATAAYAGREISTAWNSNDCGTTVQQKDSIVKKMTRTDFPPYFTLCDGTFSRTKAASKAPLMVDLSDSIRRRMTNVGRFSLLTETRHNPSVPVLILAMTGRPFTSQDFSRLYRERQIAVSHPRFAARLNDQRTHFEFDRKKKRLTQRNGNRNVIKWGDSNYDNRPIPVQDMLYPIIYNAELKDRVNDAIQDVLPLDETLWEARTATGGYIGQSGAIAPQRVVELIEERQKLDSTTAPYVVESLLLFRAHHCMADGVSLGAVFGDFMDEGEDFKALIAQKVVEFKQRRKKTPWWKRFLIFIYYWCWGGMKTILYQLSLYWQSWRDTIAHRNPWTLLREAYQKEEGLEAGEDEWEPRTISWRQVAAVQEVKLVADYFSKQTKSKITINDVFCSCISAAIVKLLQYQKVVHPTLGDRLSLPYMNLVIPVHMQGGILLPGQSMGNKIGALVSRIPGEEGLGKDYGGGDSKNTSPTSDAQRRLVQVHRILNERKQTPAAVLSYLVASFVGSWGSSEGSVAPWLFEKAHANASVVVTNVKGPEDVVHLDGRQVEAFLGFLPLPPGIPIGMVVGSYNKQITLTVTAEPWAVPDADRFLGWVVEEYQTLLEEAQSLKIMQ